MTGTGEDVGGGGGGDFEQEARARARGILANFANWMVIKVNLLRERSGENFDDRKFGEVMKSGDMAGLTRGEPWMHERGVK